MTTKWTALGAALLVMPFATPASGWPTVTHDGWRFEISTPWGYKEHNHDIVEKINGHPVRFGKHSERCDVRPGDCGITESGNWDDCANDRERTEMTSFKTLKYYSGDEYWYRWSIFFPKNHKNLWPVKVSYAEFKPIGCNPVFQILESEFGFLSRGELSLYFSRHHLYPDAKQWYVLSKDYIGKWLDFVMHVKWSHSEDGMVKLWLNGELKVDYKGKTMHCHDGVYFKYGVYRAFVSRNPKSADFGTVAYHDGIRISKSGEGMFDPLPE